MPINYPIPPSFCQFYVVRHGETDWNQLQKMQGQTDRPLTAEAISQARKLGKELRNIEFSAVFASDLIRARHTAELIALQRKATIICSKLLRERSMGSFEGVVINKLTEELRESLHQLDRSEDKQLADRFQIESAEALNSRALLFFRQTALAYPNKRALVVSHAGLMGHLLWRLGYQNITRFRQIKINNLGYFVLNCNGVEFNVVGTDNIEIKTQINI